MVHETWIDRQIREAQERGEFDNLPGAGKPLPGLGERTDPNWWVKGLMKRENLTFPLPTSLALRKEVAELPEALADVRTEQAVREIVADLNERIRDARRRHVDEPPLFIKTVSVERVVGEWRETQRLG